MFLHPEPIGPVPEETAQIARAAFPHGNVYLQMRDVLGPIYDDASFAPLFAGRGRPASAWPSLRSYSLPKGLRIARRLRLSGHASTGSTLSGWS